LDRGHEVQGSLYTAGLLFGREIVLLLKFVHDRSKYLVTIRRREIARPPKKLACPIMIDPIIRNWPNALNARVCADLVLADFSVDQSAEFGCSLQGFRHRYPHCKRINANEARAAQ
jgi:hypothetical protein